MRWGYPSKGAVMKEHKHAEVLRAIADGKEVEYRIHAEDIWRLPIDFNPIAQQHLQWRIKPEMLIREIYITDNAITLEHSKPNIRFTFDPDTKLPIKVELI
jgi:hypothetical protein